MYKILLGYLSTILGLVGFVPYFANIFKGKTKPHAFTWFVWSLINGIIFFAQISEGGGSGAWITGLNAIGCVAVFIFSLFKGEKDFPLFDWLSLFAALISLVWWWLTNDPTFSVILLTLTDLLAFLPTYRKGFYKPHEETASAFVISSFGFLIALFALESYNISTSLYPALLFFTDGLFALMLLIRRKQLRRKK